MLMLITGHLVHMHVYHPLYHDFASSCAQYSVVNTLDSMSFAFTFDVIHILITIIDTASSAIQARLIHTIGEISRNDLMFK